MLLRLFYRSVMFVLGGVTATLSVKNVQKSSDLKSIRGNIRHHFVVADIFVPADKVCRNMNPGDNVKAYTRNYNQVADVPLPKRQVCLTLGGSASYRRVQFSLSVEFIRNLILKPMRSKALGEDLN